MSTVYLLVFFSTQIIARAICPNVPRMTIDVSQAAKGGVEVHGRCWYLGAEGATCGQTCGAQVGSCGIP